MSDLAIGVYHTSRSARAGANLAARESPWGIVAPMPSAPRATRLPRRYLVPAGVGVGLACWLCLELITFAVWSLVDRQIFSASLFQARRAALTGATGGRVGATLQGTLDAYLSEEALHPYVGFVLNPKIPRTFNKFPVVSDYGFTDDKIPIQPADLSRLVVALVGGSFAQQVGLLAARELAATLRTAPASRRERSPS